MEREEYVLFIYDSIENEQKLASCLFYILLQYNTSSMELRSITVLLYQHLIIIENNQEVLRVSASAKARSILSCHATKRPGANSGNDQSAFKAMP